MYQDVKVTSYPIPNLRLPAARGEQWLLDIGCNWGRWSIAAARKGYRAVGLDPSLEAVTVARDVARQLGANALFVVADGRYLPFRDDTFDVVFSFSVLQHFAKDNVRAALHSVRRVLKASGVSLVQMLNRVGLRSLYNQARLSLRKPQQFDVRYWTTHELRAVFGSIIGPSELAVDAFFSANAQTSDIPMLPLKFQLVVHSSERLRALANQLPAIRHVADSIYVTSSTDSSRLAEVNAFVGQAH
jgi:ubiquinone/menaquinone biosynthesis C-methylase UbiE